MLWAASAIRLTARSEATEPSRSTTRAAGAPKRPSRSISSATSSPSCAPSAEALGDEDLARGAALLDRQRAAGAGLELAIDAEHAPARALEQLDDAAAVGGIARAGVGVELDAHQRARADPGGGGGFAPQTRPTDENARRVAGAVPLDRAGDQLAVAVALDDLGDDHRRQDALAREDLAAAHDRAFRFEVLQQSLQRALVLALDAKGARHVALGDACRRPAGARRRRWR